MTGLVLLLVGGWVASRIIRGRLATIAAIGAFRAHRTTFGAGLKTGAALALIALLLVGAAR